MGCGPSVHPDLHKVDESSFTVPHRNKDQLKRAEDVKAQLDDYDWSFVDWAPPFCKTIPKGEIADEVAAHKTDIFGHLAKNVVTNTCVK